MYGILTGYEGESGIGAGFQTQKCRVRPGETGQETGHNTVRIFLGLRRRRWNGRAIARRRHRINTRAARSVAGWRHRIARQQQAITVREAQPLGRAPRV